MNYRSKRLIFASGTDWSVEFLETLIKEGFKVIGVIAPPDSKKDRNQKLVSHLIKEEAQKLNIPILQPEKLSDKKFLKEFYKLKSDMVVVVAYGKLFPKEILEVPKYGFINFHPSLLPELRGPSPISSAILLGLKETGVSIMKLGEGMDDGPLLAQEKVKISPRETSEKLTRKLVERGNKILPEVLKKYLSSMRHGTYLSEQDHKKATFCKMLSKEDGKINWQKETAEQIDRKIRALNPQFKTFAYLENKKRVNILETVGMCHVTYLPGEYQLSGDDLAIGTKQGNLLVSKLQVEGKKLITATEFALGYGVKGKLL